MKDYDLPALLRMMVECNASDLFLTTGAPPQIKVEGIVQALPLPPLQVGQAHKLAYSAMSPQAIADFERTLECNMAYAPDGIGRFRINVYQQRRETGMVARLVRSQIANFETLGLPPIVRDLALLPRGLVLVIGAAGSGKTTSLAAMVDYRAATSSRWKTRSNTCSAMVPLPWTSAKSVWTRTASPTRCATPCARHPT
jgi:twitching motility protein PilU